MITGRVIANFAWQHLRAAALFRDHVVQLELSNSGRPFGDFFEEIRSYASACIMSSTASLEALINELFIAHEGKLRAALPRFDECFWGRNGIERKPILDKYQMALEFVGAARLDEKSDPFRAAWGLVELRNALVHYKPTWDPAQEREIELRDVLGGRFETSPFTDSGAAFVAVRCMGAGCARWCIKTVKSFLREFDAASRLDDPKMAAFWRIEA